MKLNFLKFTFFLLLIVFFFSCSKEEENPELPITKATIVLKSLTGAPVNAVIVYAYNQNTFETQGDKKAFANGQVASDGNGNAVFANLEYINTFSDLNNNQNVFRFSAHYNLNGVDKQKVTAITFIKGEQKTQTVFLD